MIYRESNYKTLQTTGKSTIIYTLIVYRNEERGGGQQILIEFGNNQTIFATGSEYIFRNYSVPNCKIIL